jgi:hypothetical protein
MRVYVTFVLCSICILAGACGNSLPLASSLSVAITPPTATVTAGTRVNLTGSDSGFTETPGAEWQMVERGQLCGFLAGFTQKCQLHELPSGVCRLSIQQVPKSSHVQCAADSGCLPRPIHGNANFWGVFP